MSMKVLSPVEYAAQMAAERQARFRQHVEEALQRARAAAQRRSAPTVAPYEVKPLAEQLAELSASKKRWQQAVRFVRGGAAGLGQRA